MDFSIPEDVRAIRGAVRELCGNYPDAYWRKLDKTSEYPTEFVKALTDAGWLAALSTRPSPLPPASTSSRSKVLV